MTGRQLETDDDEWMQRALALARDAACAGEVPVGALIVREGRVVSEGWNRPVAQHDPTAHAEIVALRAAGASLGNYRLVGCDLYVTLEPCLMCAGAMIHARINRLVFGAFDPRAGAAGSIVDAFSLPQLNHRVRVCGGVRQAECGDLLRGFFRARR
jgi:tRNA(adenine34) deaminase